MAWREIEGLRLPVPVAGDPALELCNTRAGWSEDAPREYLVDLSHALVLADDLGLMPAPIRPLLQQQLSRDPGASRQAYGQLLQLRAALYAMVTGQAADEDVHRLNTTMLTARRHLRLVSTEAGPEWSRDWSRPSAIVDVFAAAGERLLRNPAAATVARCPGRGCGWVFLNPSGRRRWCSMQWCGNRAKARRHALRSRQGPESPFKPA